MKHTLSPPTPDQVAQLGEGDPMADNRIRDSPTPIVRGTHEDQAANLL